MYPIESASILLIRPKRPPRSQLFPAGSSGGHQVFMVTFFCLGFGSLDALLLSSHCKALAKVVQLHLIVKIFR